ncbi:MAG: hypothetical protein HRT72_08485 [Flavobacteriales bacterium]|nr:hypothetical protein [Flavobacteriales bacterium]
MAKKILPRLFYTRKAWMHKTKKIIKRYLKDDGQQNIKTSGIIHNPLFDLSKLDKLSNGNPFFVPKMVQVFIDELPPTLSRLTMHSLRNEIPRVKAVAHVMKPSIRMMGIESAIPLVEQIEDFSERKIHLEQIPELVKELVTVCNNTIKQLTICQNKQLFNRNI